MSSLAIKSVPLLDCVAASTMAFGLADEQIKTGVPALVAKLAAISFVVIPPVPFFVPASPAISNNSGVISLIQSKNVACGFFTGLSE